MTQYERNRIEYLKHLMTLLPSQFPESENFDDTEVKFFFEYPSLYKVVLRNWLGDNKGIHINQI